MECGVTSEVLYREVLLFAAAGLDPGRWEQT